MAAKPRKPSAKRSPSERLGGRQVVIDLDTLASEMSDQTATSPVSPAAYMPSVPGGRQAGELNGESAESPQPDAEMMPEAYYPRGAIDVVGSQNAISIEEKREDTRGRLATIYTVSTFIVFILGFIVSILDALLRNTSIIDNLVKVLPLISGIFLGSLGFVLGYYFRKAEEEK